MKTRRRTRLVSANLKASSTTRPLALSDSHFFIIYGTVTNLDIYNDPRFPPPSLALLPRPPPSAFSSSTIFNVDRWRKKKIEVRFNDFNAPKKKFLWHRAKVMMGFVQNGWAKWSRDLNQQLRATSLPNKKSIHFSVGWPVKSARCTTQNAPQEKFQH